MLTAKKWTKEVMGSYSEYENDDIYYDACEEGFSDSDRRIDCSDCCSSSFSCIDDVLGHEIWSRCPESVTDRRGQFLRITGLRLDRSLVEKEETWPSFYDESEVDTNRITKDSGTVLLGSYDCSSSIESSSSSGSKQEGEIFILSNSNISGNNLRARSKDSNDGTEFSVDEFAQVKTQIAVRGIGFNYPQSIEELRLLVGSSPLVQPSIEGSKLDIHMKELFHAKERVKNGWLRKFGVGACGIAGNLDVYSKPDDLELIPGMKMRKIRSHSQKKKHKELSSLYAGQEFLAHEGAISCMKFSFDGQYLASAGEDATVRIWRVSEEGRLDNIDISDLDPSSMYFAINQSSELASLNMDKEHMSRLKRVGRQGDSCCVILPSKVFHLLEKPWHELRGHTGEILDLAWSKKGVSGF